MGNHGSNGARRRSIGAWRLLGLGLLACPLVAQDSDPEAPADPAQARRLLLDGVAAVIGDEVVTHRQVDYFRQLEARSGRSVDPATILQRLVKDKLKSQAGQTLILDESLVESRVESLWRERLEERGGAVATSEQLGAWGMTPPRLREMWKSDLYAQVWEEHVTGSGLGPTGRPKVDRFIRPGQRLAFYRILKSSPNPADQAKVGVRPERVVIQQLVLAAEEYGGVEDTRTLAGELRELAASGRSDFGDLVARYGAAGTRESRGLGAPIAMADMEQLSVTRHRTRALLDFVAGSEPGALSEPILGWKLGADVEAIFVYKLVDRLPAEKAKDPVNVELQKELDEALLEQIDKVRLDFALREAFDSAYIWTAGQGRPGEGPAAEAGQDG